MPFRNNPLIVAFVLCVIATVLVVVSWLANAR
jgi:hypothetical protein